MEFIIPRNYMVALIIEFVSVYLDNMKNAQLYYVVD